MEGEREKGEELEKYCCFAYVELSCIDFGFKSSLVIF